MVSGSPLRLPFRVVIVIISSIVAIVVVIQMIRSSLLVFLRMYAENYQSQRGYHCSEPNLSWLEGVSEEGTVDESAVD